MWASPHTNTCHPSQDWRQVLPAACRTGLPKPYKQQVLLLWGKWQMQREEGKT